MRKFALILILMVSLLAGLKLVMAEHCPNCVINWCRTTYPTYGDGDGDGMNDEYEMELARQFKPTLYYDDANIGTVYFTCITGKMKTFKRKRC